VNNKCGLFSRSSHRYIVRIKEKRLGMKTGNKRDIATSFTSLMFLVIGISGVMLYFHFYDMQVRELHETLGLVFVVATIFHIFVNWKSMKNYFSKKIFIFALIMTALLASGFIVKSLNQDVNPKLLVIQSVLKAPLEKSFDLFNVKYDDAVKKLEKQNIRILDNKTIFEVAKASKTSPFRIVLIITSQNENNR